MCKLSNLVIFYQCFIQVLSEETVFVQPHSTPKFFQVPTSETPVVAWMDIHKGIYPNTSLVNSMIRVGEPITIFIYLKDNSFMYDIEVTDCWAYDNQVFANSKNKLHLMEDYSNKNMKVIDKWYREDFPKGQPLKTLLYTDLVAFKFPDEGQIYMKCDVQFAKSLFLMTPGKY